MEESNSDPSSISNNWWQNLTEEEFQATFRLNLKTLIDLQAEIDYLEGIHNDRIETELLICLWFLGSMESLNKANELFRISNAETVLQTYLTKLLQLGSLYLIWPSEEEAKLIENGFVSQYKFPNIIGVIGSLHIDVNVRNIVKNKRYFNKLMQKHTIVLQIVCDHNLLLRNVCVGCPGGKGIQTIFESSPLFGILTSTNNSMSSNSHHLLGGTELPQLDTLLIPYVGNELTEEQSNFNLSHSAVMCSVESTFKCMENRFPRFTNVDDLHPTFASLVIGSICVLHNFTRVRNDRCEQYS